MEDHHGLDAAMPEQQNGQNNGDTWGAKVSLRRNATLSRRTTEEEYTPLLDSGTRSRNGSEDGGERRDSTWSGERDFDGLPWWRMPSIYWLLPPFFLFTLAMGGLLVPKLNLILSLVCREYFIEQHTADPTTIFTPVILGSNNPQCRIPEIQALATKFTLYMTIIAGALSAIIAPKMGAISDRHGRLRPLAIASFGGFIAEIITIVAATYPDTVHYNWLLAGSVFDGLCGSFTAGMALTHAYTSDCTSPQKRSVAFGYIHASLFAGIAIGPLIAALVVKLTHSLIAMFYFALGIHTCFIIFLLTVVPESLTLKRQLLAREKYAEANELLRNDQMSLLMKVKRYNILAPLKILFPTGPGTRDIRSNLILLSSVDTMIFGIAMGAMTVIIYYSGYQFGWDTAQISVFTSLVNVFRVSTLVVVLPLLNYLIRTRPANRERRLSGHATPIPNSGCDTLDLSIIRVAIFFEIVGYAGYALARVSPLFVVSGVVASIGGIASPTLQSTLTKHVPHENVGQLLGATGLLHALARIVCPLIFNMIYALTVKSFPQAVFVVLSSCFFLAFLCSWFIKANVYLEDPITPQGRRSTDTDDEADALLDEDIAGV